MSTADRPPQPPSIDHSRADVRVHRDVLPRSLIVRTLLAAVMIGASLCFATYLILHARLLTLRPSYRFPESALPAPREVAGVRQELFRIAHPRPSGRDEQRGMLETFGWVDRDRRIVRVPIELAIDIAARAAAADGSGR
jgi:hypothetical protein